MTPVTIHKILSWLIALVWLINGLYCKVLNMVPRHQEIVGKILGNEHAGGFTKVIGFAEIGMAIWIVSNYLPRLNAITQVTVIALMNILEFILVPGLLLWGRWNLLFALLFILLILFNECFLSHETVQSS